MHLCILVHGFHCKLPLEYPPQVYRYALLITELGTKVIAQPLRNVLYRAIVDSADVAVKFDYLKLPFCHVDLSLSLSQRLLYLFNP
jgi:hypothetical protein